jgi:hypothetical protein
MYVLTIASSKPTVDTKYDTGVTNCFDPVLYNDGSGNLTISCGFNLTDPAAKNFLAQTGDPTLIAMALVDADFNLGLPDFQELVGTYVKSGDWNEVASILSSQAGKPSLIADSNAISAYLNAAHGNVGNGGGQGGSSRF